MVRLRHSTTIAINDFPPAFLFVSLLSASAVLVFARLPRDAGAELSGRKAIEKAKESTAAAPR
jgi:hypothetical protein